MTIDFERPGKSVQDLVVETDQGRISAGSVCVINNGPGPRVLIVGGIHGDEFEAQLALHGLIAQIDEKTVRGRLIIIPEVNRPASGVFQRCAPSDGANLNRCFPGNRNGSPTERLAACLFEDIRPQADLLIDVHSGGPSYTGEAIAFAFHGPACKMPEAEIVAVMDAFGLPYVVYQPGISSTFVGAAPDAGVAAIELDGGGTTLIESVNIEIFRDGLLRGLVHLGALAIEPPPHGLVSRHLDVLAQNMFEAPVAGLLEHRVRMGQTVETGDLVAAIHPIDRPGAEPHRIEAEAPGIVISQRSLLKVVAGDCLGNTGTPR
jgi:N-alpha-acetyl-L-2,4-diaminobutyrate deacetylase